MNDEDLNKKFKQIAEMLGKENVQVPDNIGSIISMLANSSNSKEATPQKAEVHAPEHREAKEAPVEKNSIDDNIEMMRKVKSIMDGMRSVNDPRVNLLSAISPFLNNNRQKKIGNCIKIFQMTQITRMMGDMEKNS